MKAKLQLEISAVIKYFVLVTSCLQSDTSFLPYFRDHVERKNNQSTDNIKKGKKEENLNEKMKRSPDEKHI